MLPSLYYQCLCWSGNRKALVQVTLISSENVEAGSARLRKGRSRYFPARELRGGARFQGEFVLLLPPLPEAPLQKFVFEPPDAGKDEVGPGGAERGPLGVSYLH